MYRKINDEEAVIVFILLVIGAIVCGIMSANNEQDKNQGRIVQSTALVYDMQLAGKYNTPTLILFFDDKYISVGLDNLTQLYSCSKIKNKIKIDKFIGKSGKLRAINIYCEWGTFYYSPFLRSVD